MDTARLIREARKAAGLTQRQLARAAGTSQPTLTRYENGHVTPSIATLERILRAAGYDPELSLESTGAARSGSAREALERHRATVRTVLDQHGVSDVRIFGSAARGEDHPGSDLDLLVDMEEPSYIRLAALRAELEDVLGIPVDVTVKALLAEPIRDNAERHAIPL